MDTKILIFQIYSRIHRLHHHSPSNRDKFKHHIYQHAIITAFLVAGSCANSYASSEKSIEEYLKMDLSQLLEMKVTSVAKREQSLQDNVEGKGFGVEGALAWRPTQKLDFDLIYTFHELEVDHSVQEGFTIVSEKASPNHIVGHRAAYIYNFLRLITWSESGAPADDSIIDVFVYGTTPFGVDLKKLESKMVDTHPIRVHLLHYPEERISPPCLAV